MPLPLNSVVNVSYNLPGIVQAQQSFNLGLILGSSTIISPATRVVVYNSLQEVKDAGFTTGSAEYLAATAYFAASSQPTRVAIGRIDVAETVLQAITACRDANQEWYMAYAPTSVDGDQAAIGAYVEALTSPKTMYIFQSSTAGILTNAASNIFQTMATAAYKHVHYLYSTSAHMAAAVMGYVMGQVSDLSSSAFTITNKSLNGFTPDNLTSTQVTNIQLNNGSCYVKRGNTYNVYENGKVASGAWLDEIVYLDKMTNDVQTSVMNLLYTNPKIPQTEDGMAQIKSTISRELDKYVGIGFVAPGKWTGLPVSTLKTGDTLPAGYVVLSDAIVSQSQSDRDARKAPPVYVACKLAGALQSIVITVNVNR